MVKHVHNLNTQSLSVGQEVGVQVRHTATASGRGPSVQRLWGKCTHTCPHTSRDTHARTHTHTHIQTNNHTPAMWDGTANLLPIENQNWDGHRMDMRQGMRLEWQSRQDGLQPPDVLRIEHRRTTGGTWFESRPSPCEHERFAFDRDWQRQSGGNMHPQRARKKGGVSANRGALFSKCVLP